MRKLFLIFLILSILLSCSDKSKIPKEVLSPKKMREVMWDMIRAGEFLNSFVLYKDTAMNEAAVSQRWYNKIYQLHKITEKDFDRSYAWYQAHPVLMKELLDSLSKKQVPVSQYGQSSSASKDSLNKKDTVAAGGKRKLLIDTLNRKRIIDTFNRRRIIDTLNRKRILKKRFNKQ